MAQKVGLINGSANLNRDVHFSKPLQNILNQGVISGLTPTQAGGPGTNITVPAGIAVVEVTRTSVTPNETFLVYFENTANVTLTVGTDKKIFVEITQANIDTASSNTNADGTGIGEIKIASAYPSGNYIKLGETDAVGGGTLATTVLETSTIKDSKITNLATTKLTGGNWKVFYTNGSGVVTEIDLGSATQVLTSNGASEAPTFQSAGAVDIAGQTEIDEVADDDEFLVYDLSTTSNKKASITKLKNNIYLQENVLIGSDVIGETVSQGDALFYESMVASTSVASYSNIGETSSNKRLAVKAIGSGVAGTTISGKFERQGLTATDLNFRIETDNSGSPSGTLVDVNAYGTTGFATSTTSNAHGVNLSSSSGGFTGFNGMTCSTTKKIRIDSITKHNSCTATRGGITYNASTTYANFVGNVATFATPVVIDANTSFFIGADSSGGSYIYTYSPGASSNTVAPITWNSSGATTYQNLISLTYVIQEQGTATLNASVTITKGTPVWLVLYQGTYSSETTDSGNYFKMGYYNINTTTRDGKTWNGSVWSTVNTYFYYNSSTLFKDKILSKTNATYSYKLPNIPIISRNNYTIGTLAKFDFQGISNIKTGLTEQTDYYLSNTPGAISTSAGTNKCQIGTAIKTDGLELKVKKHSVAITVGTSPFTWQNTTGGPVQYIVKGGTVNPVAISKDNSTFYTVATATNYMGTLAQGDYLKITYSSAPTLEYSDL